MKQEIAETSVAETHEKTIQSSRLDGVGELYAALDLGTNNCRLLIARPSFQQHSQHKTLKVVDSYSRIVRLGEGVSDTGRLGEEAMRRTMRALSTCKQKLNRYGIAKYRFVATEACRRASNAETFLNRVRDELGLTIDIISNEEEARLAFLGCSSLLMKDTSYALAFDIGGGSTEFMWVKIDPEQPLNSHKRHLIQDWVSLPYGVMNMSEQFGGPAFTEMYFEEIVAKISSLLMPMERDNQIAARMWKEDVQMLSTSGTVTTLAAIHLDLPPPLGWVASNALITSGASSARKSCTISVAPGMGGTSSRSQPITNPCVPTLASATCAQPPGAQPRSTTRIPGLRMWNFSSRSSNLKAARLR